MVKARSGTADGKVRVKGISLRLLLKGRLGSNKRKKGKRSVRFVPALPPVEKSQSGEWEVYMNSAIKEMVLLVIREKIGSHVESNCRPWMGIHCPNDHPKCELEDYDDDYDSEEEDEAWQEWEEEEVDEGESIWHSLVYAFNQAARHSPSRARGESDDYCQMVAPITCAFVHQTGWTNKLREFRKNSVAWLDSVRTESRELFKSKDIRALIFTKANYSYDRVSPSDDEFWRGFDSSEQPFGKMFIDTIGIYCHKICDLIHELEEEYDRPGPSSVESVLSRRLWEVLVIDWIHKEDVKAYLFLYGTPGEYFYYKDFMQLENYFYGRDFME